jgi:hypothetical protein
LLTTSIKVNVPELRSAVGTKGDVSMSKQKRPTRGFWDWWFGSGSGNTGSDG